MRHRHPAQAVACDQDAVRADLLGVVQRSLEPTHATVWVRPVR